MRFPSEVLACYIVRERLERPPVAAQREKRNFRHNFLLHDGLRVARESWTVDTRSVNESCELPHIDIGESRASSAHGSSRHSLAPGTGSSRLRQQLACVASARQYRASSRRATRPDQSMLLTSEPHPEISSPLEGAPAQPVFRGQVHQWTTARRPPKSSKIVQDRPTRKTPFRLASALRISFRLRDIRSGPRFFGEPTNVVGLVCVNVFTNLAAVHYLPGGHFAPRPCGRLALVLAERNPQHSNQGFASANPRRPAGDMALAWGVSPRLRPPFHHRCDNRSLEKRTVIRPKCQ